MKQNCEEVLRTYLAEPTVENRNAVVAAHRYLCVRGARKFYRGTVERSDLEQVAAIGLIKASMRYDKTYETPFEAYAWLMIVGELMHFVRDHEGAVRIPRYLRALEKRYRLSYDRLSATYGREPSTRELAGDLGVDIDDIDKLRLLKAHRLAEEEGDDRGSFGGEYQRLSASIDDTTPDVDDRLTLADALRRLSVRERHIVREIFFHDATQAQVGRELGISQRQVSRVLAKTLQRLAHLIAA